MKITLQIASWIAVAIGVLTVLAGVGETASGSPDAIYSLVGGAMFLTQGVLALVYIDQQGK